MTGADYINRPAPRCSTKKLYQLQSVPRVVLTQQNTPANHHFPGEPWLARCSSVFSLHLLLFAASSGKQCSIGPVSVHPPVCSSLHIFKVTHQGATTSSRQAVRCSQRYTSCPRLVSEHSTSQAISWKECLQIKSHFVTSGTLNLNSVNRLASEQNVNVWYSWHSNPAEVTE